jgi:hypothetical protein
MTPPRSATDRIAQGTGPLDSLPERVCVCVCVTLCVPSETRVNTHQASAKVRRDHTGIFRL